MTWSQPSAPLPAVRRARRQRSQNLPLRTLILKLLDGSLLHWKVDVGFSRGFLTGLAEGFFFRLLVVGLLATAVLFVAVLALIYALPAGIATGVPRSAESPAVSRPLALPRSSNGSASQATSSNEIAVPPPAEPLVVVLKAPVSAAAPATGRLQVPNTKQERTLNCEFRSATDLAAYYDKHFSWEELFEIVGYDPGGDPNKGFAGQSVDDPPGGIYPAGYGVYAEPVARGLKALGVAATAYKGQTVEWIKQKLAAGHPVMVWATAYMGRSETVEWQTTDGVTVNGVPYEHTYNVVGYDESGVWVNDPYTATTDHYTWEKFQASWALLGNMALSIDEPLAK